jgi:hypothetical protein
MMTLRTHSKLVALSYGAPREAAWQQCAIISRPFPCLAASLLDTGSIAARLNPEVVP